MMCCPWEMIFNTRFSIYFPVLWSNCLSSNKTELYHPQSCSCHCIKLVVASSTSAQQPSSPPLPTQQKSTKHRLAEPFSFPMKPRIRRVHCAWRNNTNGTMEHNPYPAYWFATTTYSNMWASGICTAAHRQMSPTGWSLMNIDFNAERNTIVVNMPVCIQERENFIS